MGGAGRAPSPGGPRALARHLRGCVRPARAVRDRVPPAPARRRVPLGPRARGAALPRGELFVGFGGVCVDIDATSARATAWRARSSASGACASRPRRRAGCATGSWSRCCRSCDLPSRAIATWAAHLRGQTPRRRARGDRAQRAHAEPHHRHAARARAGSGDRRASSRCFPACACSSSVTTSSSSCSKSPAPMCAPRRARKRRSRRSTRGGPTWCSPSRASRSSARCARCRRSAAAACAPRRSPTAATARARRGIRRAAREAGGAGGAARDRRAARGIALAFTQ